MSDLHREKTQTSTLEYSRKLGKTWPESWGPLAIGQGRAARGARVVARGQEPIRFYLTDPTSTNFED
jgi:hypothetical protein